jgi:hypothetical protein
LEVYLNLTNYLFFAPSAVNLCILSSEKALPVEIH